MKFATLLLITVLALSSLVMVDSAFAEPVPKLSVPDFTLKLVDYDVIEVKIKNQPVNVIDYNVRIKRQFSENWTELYHPPQEDIYNPFEYPCQSESDYTVLSFSVSDPAGDQVDVQVEALVGVWIRPGAALAPVSVPSVYDVVATSGWSSTQTITLSTPSPPPTPSPIPPAVVGSLLGVVIVAIVFGAVLLLIYQKRKPKQTQTQLSKWQ